MFKITFDQFICKIQNCFQEVQSNPEAKSPVDDQDISNFTINSDKFIAIGEFVRKSRLRMLFDLNDLIRNPDWTWNNSNAREIIKFAKAYDLDVDWQLANGNNTYYTLIN